MTESYTVKITMPKQMAEEFITESDKYFYGCRWLNILFKQKIYNLINNKSILTNIDLQRELNNMRADLFLVLKYYLKDKKGE